MKETRPQFIIRKYRSILRAAVIVEAVILLSRSQTVSFWDGSDTEGLG